MFKAYAEKKLQQMEAHYDYNVDYMRYILEADGKAFFKFSLFQIMSNHTGDLPPAIYSAATIRAALVDDCGPCIQLVVDMAIEAGVPEKVVAAIVAGRRDELPDDIAATVGFTDLVMAHNPEADELREVLLEKFGDKGLVAISFAIASARVYPALKYALGYGKTCHKVKVGTEALAPVLAVPA
ncbi:MAG: hypothetical protein ACE37D_07675 [Pseudomonadales bacterium]